VPRISCRSAGQAFEPAQRAERLGLVVERALQACRQRGVDEVGDGRDQVVVVHAMRPARTPASKWVSMKSARPSKVLSSVGAGAEQRVQHRRILEQPMKVQAEHVAARVLPGQPLGHHGLAVLCHLGVGGGLPVVDFVAGHRHVRQRGPVAGQRAEGGCAVAHGLLALEHRHQRQQAQAGRVAVDAVRIDQRLAQHLQAAANAQHRAATGGMFGHGAVQPCARSQARSPLVCLEPGSTIQSAAATSAGVRAQTSRTPGTFLSDWNSSRLLMRG
jgi:hypothetical protein